jgi:hypothetical protein
MDNKEGTEDEDLPFQITVAEGRRRKRIILPQSLQSRRRRAYRHTEKRIL